MQRIESIDEIKVGMVILTGTAYYQVTDAGFPEKFRGRMWVEIGQAWGREVGVPFPSPTYDAYSVSPDLFRTMP